MKRLLKYSLFSVLALFVLSNCTQEPRMATPDMDISLFPDTYWIVFNGNRDSICLKSTVAQLAAVKYNNSANVTSFFETILAKIERQTTIILDDGNFIIDNAIALKPNMEIMGKGETSNLISSNGEFFIGDNVYNVKLKGIKLKSTAGSSSSNAIKISGNSTKVIFDGVFVEEFAGSAILFDGAACKDNVVMNCSMIDIGGRGISFINGASGLIESNYVESSGKEGLYLDKTKSVTVRSNTVLQPGSASLQEKYSAYTINESEDITIESNTAGNSLANGINVTKSSFVRVVKNTVSSNELEGVKVFSSDSISIYSNSFFVIEGDGILISGSSATPSKKLLIDSNNISYIEGDAAVNVEYTQDCVISKNTFVPGVNPATQLVVQGDGNSGIQNKDNVIDTESKMPVAVCRYVFDTLGSHKYNNPFRFADFSLGNADFDAGKQMILDAGEDIPALNTHKLKFDAKHTISKQKINGKERFVITANPENSEKYRLDPNNSTIRSWQNPSVYNLSGSTAKTITFWLKFAEKAPTRPSGHGSSIINIGAPSWVVSGDAQCVSVVLVKNGGDKNLKVIFSENKFFTVPVPLKDNTWYHVIVRFPENGNMSDVDLLLNGTKVSSHQNDSSLKEVVNTEARDFVWITTWFSHGISLADVRFYDSFIEDKYVNLLLLQ